MREMEAKFDKWSLAETRSAVVTSTAGTTAVVVSANGTVSEDDTSSFVNVSSPSPVNLDSFDTLDDFHEDVLDSHFHQ